MPDYALFASLSGSDIGDGTVIKTFYRGCKILLFPGSVSIWQGDEEFTAKIEMDMPGLMKWAKRKIDRWRKF